MARLADIRVVPALAGAAMPDRVSRMITIWPNIAEYSGAAAEQIGNGSCGTAGSKTSVVRRFRRRAAASSC
jgi:hypothetical protein